MHMVGIAAISMPNLVDLKDSSLRYASMLNTRSSI